MSKIDLPEVDRGQHPASRCARFWPPATARNSWIMVGLGRIELPTSPLSGVRSSQLSYRPVNPRRAFHTSLAATAPAALAAFQASSSHLVELVGIEPATS